MLVLLMTLFTLLDMEYPENRKRREWAPIFLIPYVTATVLGAFLLADEEERKTTRFLFNLAADRSRILREKVVAHALLWVVAFLVQTLLFVHFPAAGTFKEPLQSVLLLFASGILLCVLGYECAGICSLYLNNTTICSLGGFALMGVWLAVVMLVLFSLGGGTVAEGTAVGALLVSAVLIGGVLRWLFLRREAK